MSLADIQAMKALRLAKQMVSAQPSVNQFNVANTTSGYLSGGTIVSDSTYVTSEYLPVQNGDVIRYTYDSGMGEGHSVFMYDTNKNYLSNITGTVDANNTYRTATIANANAVYIRVSFTKTVSTNAMITKNNAYPSYYITCAIYNVLNNAYQITENNLNMISVSQTSDNILDTSKNLTGNYLNGSSLVANSSYFTSDFIPVINGDTIRYSYDSNMGLNHGVYLYDSNKNYLTNTVGSLDVNSIYRTSVLNNTNVAYIRISYFNSSLNTAMIIKNKSYPASYVAYSSKKYLNDNFSLNNTQLTQVQQSSIANPLSGKIISFNGDSICYGAGFGGGYGQIIANRNNMIYENRGVSGGTIASNTYSDPPTNSQPRHWVSTDIVNMRSDADYIILEGGVNDGTLATPVPMGTITTDYSSTLDTTTFCGAFEYMLQQAINRYPGKKIGYIFVHNMSSAQANYNSNAVQILQKWGIPFIDLYHNCPSLNYNSYLKTNYTSGDGWHPNQQGYLKYYCDPIEAWMKTL